MCSREKGTGNGGRDWCCVNTNQDSEKINRREIVRPKNVRTDQNFFQREREREEMSMRQREDNDGGEERCVKIDGASKKSNSWKSLKEMKEYLRSEFEKKTTTLERNGGETYLHFTAYLNDVDATKMLIEDNAAVNAADENKCTALHIALKKGHFDVAKVLIQNGADVNAVNKDKDTAIHLHPSQ